MSRRRPLRLLTWLLLSFFLVSTVHISPVLAAPPAGAAAIDIKAGRSHTLALNEDGTVWAWGSNLRGALGTGTSITEATFPVQVANLTSIIAVAVGQNRSLALKSDGTVWAWGENGSGELGTGTKKHELIPVQVDGLPSITAIAAGEGHFLALAADGSLWSWGLNTAGQLGDGSTTTQTAPAKVPGLSGVQAIAAGYRHSLAVLADGSLWAWGLNQNRQLGDRTQIDRKSPVQVVGPANVVEAAANELTSMARTADGQVWFWGLSSFPGYFDPTPVPGLTGIDAIAAGHGHYLALKSDGMVWAWGANEAGQLGLGTTVEQPHPTLVSGLADVDAIAAGGSASFALTQDGSLWGWGKSSQLGRGAIPGDARRPGILPPLLLDATAPTWTAGAIVASDVLETSLKLTWSGAGDNLEVVKYLLLIDGKPSAVEYLTPEATVEKLTRGTEYLFTVQAVDSFGNVSTDGPSLAVTTLIDGMPPSWPSYALEALDATEDSLKLSWRSASPGVTDYRIYQDGVQLAQIAATAGLDFESYQVTGLLPDTDYVFTVQAGDGLGNWTSEGPTLHWRWVDVGTGSDHWIGAGSRHGILMHSNGRVFAWGADDYAQLGTGARGSTPVVTGSAVPGLQGVVAAATGYTRTAVVRNDGSVWTWGIAEKSGAVATPANLLPTPVSGLSNAVAVAAGDGHFLALKSDGTVWAWGQGGSGQLGDGGKADRANPVAVSGLSGVKAIDAGRDYSVALKNDGTLWIWGRLAAGSASNAPTRVLGLPTITAIAAGANHVLAIDTAGQVWAWGDNSTGQLGDGSQSLRIVPIQVSNLSRVVSVAAGQTHSLARTQDGQVWAWGENSHGQLGDGTDVDSLVPVQVTGLTNVTAIAAGDRFSLALTTDETLWAWGTNSRAQLARTLDLWSTPTPVRANMPWFDYDPPTWPAGAAITVELLLHNRATITWSAATDASSYRVYLNGQLRQQVPASVRKLDLTNLTASVAYTITVQAGDAHDNWTQDGPQLDLVTPAADLNPPIPGVDEKGSPNLQLAVQREGRWALVTASSVTRSKMTFEVGTAGLQGYALTGTMSKPLSQVKVNGKSTGVEIMGEMFIAPIEPVKGSNSYTLEAFDLAGNKGTMPSVELILDAGPVLTIRTPAVLSTTINGKQPIVLSGSADEPIASLIALNIATGQEIPANVILDGESFTVALSLPAGVSGTYPVRLVAYDKLGNPSLPDGKGRDSRTVTVKAEPPGSAKISAPLLQDGVISITTTTLKLEGEAEPGSLVEVLLPSGKRYSTTASKNGRFELKSIAVAEGPSEIELRAYDNVGNQSEPVRVIVIRDTQGPAVLESALSYEKDGAQEVAGVIKGTSVTHYVPSAPEYTLRLVLDEPVEVAKLNGDVYGYTVVGEVVTAILTDLKSGANKYTFDLADRYGTTSKIAVTVTMDNQPPVITVSKPGDGASFGLTGKETDDTVAVTFTGSANEALSALEVLDELTGLPVALPVQVKIDDRNPRNWSATIWVSATDPAQTWAVRFQGTDLAGNLSLPHEKGSDRRSFQVDPVRPQLDLINAVGGGILFTGQNNLSYGITKGKMTVSGALSDAHSGVKQVLVGTTSLKPKVATDYFAFETSVSLSEGKLTSIKVVGEDNAGNRSPQELIQVLLKSKISKLSGSARWTKAKDLLTITGRTDAAILVNGDYVAVVPVEVVITSTNSGEVYRQTVDASTAAYNLKTGTFTLDLDTTGWAKEKYVITFEAKAPAEFPDLAAKTYRLTFTIK